MKQARSILVYRASSSDKAQIVELIKSFGTGNMTLAIGDGANDLEMLDAAHLSVGIAHNGSSIAKARADISLSKFKHVQRLLVWHGA